MLSVKIFFPGMVFISADWMAFVIILMALSILSLVGSMGGASVKSSSIAFW